MFVVALAYLAMFPQDLAAATGLPFSSTVQLIAALTLGTVLLLAAHFAAEKLHELEEARSSRARDPGKFESLKREAIVAIVIPVGVIVSVALWRGQTFAAESKAVGGLFHSAAAANLAFTALAAAAFLATVAAARSYFRKKPLREIQRKRRLNGRVIRELQETIDTNERIEKQAVLTHRHLTEHEEKTLAAIEAWRQGRTKKLRHRAGKAHLKAHKKLVNKGLRPPEPPTTAPTRREPNTPSGGGNAVRARINLGDLADQVRTTTNGTKK